MELRIDLRVLPRNHGMLLENSERSTIVNLYMPNGSFLICRRRRLDLYILYPTEYQPTEPPTTCGKVHQNKCLKTRRTGRLQIYEYRDRKHVECSLTVSYDIPDFHPATYRNSWHRRSVLIPR
jgi:hypothetical protein